MDEKIYFIIQEKLYYYDFLKLVSSIKKIKIVRAVFAVLAVLLAAFMWFVMNLQGYIIIRWLYIILIGELIGLCLSVHRNNAKVNYKAVCALEAQNPIDCEVIIGENHIYANRLHTKAYYDYCQIYKVEETKEYFFIMITESQGLIVKKDSFVQGDVNALSEFFKSKGIKV